MLLVVYNHVPSMPIDHSASLFHSTISSNNLSPKGKSMSSDAIFCLYFDPFSTQLHFTFLTPPFFFMFILIMFVLLCLSSSRTDDKNMIQLVQLVTEQLVYWATDIPKQSCCGSSSTRSCTGTSSAATEHSHHSKFWTSRTWSMSRSASTA